MTLDDIMPRREITVHLHDEIPKLGNGVRKVFVVSVGPKNVVLRKRGSETNINVRRSVWNAILSSKANVNAMEQQP